MSSTQDIGGPCNATPHGTLIEQILDSRIAKNEREWAAAKEIESLRSQVAALTAQRDAMVVALEWIEEYWNGSENEMAMSDACHAVVDIARSALALINRGGGEQEQPEEREANKPIGTCPKCHTPVYTDEGFCGVCRPH
jgi:hypothetical protein